jgi:DNA-directed RNA polymerase specialized sigma24 family protein
LDEIYRDILYLHYVAELKTGEISILLNKPYNTVRSNLKRGKVKFFQKLEEGVE